MTRLGKTGSTQHIKPPTGEDLARQDNMFHGSDTSYRRAKYQKRWLSANKKDTSKITLSRVRIQERDMD